METASEHLYIRTESYATGDQRAGEAGKCSGVSGSGNADQYVRLLPGAVGIISQTGTGRF